MSSRKLVTIDVINNIVLEDANAFVDRVEKVSRTANRVTAEGGEAKVRESIKLLNELESDLGNLVRSIATTKESIINVLLTTLDS